MSHKYAIRFAYVLIHKYAKYASYKECEIKQYVFIVS